MVFQPAFGGVDFTILLHLPVLGDDELRTQRDGIGLAGRDDHGSDGTVIMGHFPVLVLEAGTVGAANVFALRGKIPGAVQGDQTGVVNAAQTLQNALLVQGLINLVVDAKQFLRFHRIEHVADMDVGGNLIDLEEALSVALALVLFHVLLVSQKTKFRKKHLRF